MPLSCLFPCILQLFNKNLVTRSIAHLDEDDELDLEEHPAPVIEEEPPVPQPPPQPKQPVQPPQPSVTSMVEQPSFRERETARAEQSRTGKVLQCFPS